VVTAIVEKFYVAVIDDDDGHCRALARLLRAAGMQSIAYASAEEFRSDLKQPRFHCLVVDVQLPGMSGIELRDRLAAEGIRTPVLFMTAHDNPKAREQALAGPHVGYFRKTGSGSEILEAIRRGGAALAPGS
jgi:FixJ family two-component response regulator